MWKTYEISFKLKTLLPLEKIEEAISHIDDCFHIEDCAKVCDTEEIVIKQIENKEEE